MQDTIFFISKNIILVSLWFFFLITVIFLITKSIFLKFKIINNTEAIKLINQDNAIVIDTRSLDFFKKGHIINSINIPLEKIFLGEIKKIEIYKSSPIILVFNERYKHSKCIKQFLKYGFKHIFILKNGIYNWNFDHLPLVKKER